MKPKAAGSLGERRPGVLEFRLYVGRDPVSHKHRWLSHTWRGNKRDRGKALAAWVSEHTGAHEIIPTRQTITWLVDKWFDHQGDAQLSPTTLRIKPTLGRVTLANLTAGHVRDLHAKMAAAGKQDSTIRQVHAVLRGALTYGMQGTRVSGCFLTNF
jgi:hypothetical protein